MKKPLLAAIMVVSLSGCATLAPPQKGCISFSESGPSAESTNIAWNSFPHPYSSTLLQFESGLFTYPVASIDTIERFRSNLYILTKKNKNLRKVTASELIKITALDSTSPEKADYSAIVSEAVQATSISGISVTTTLISIEQMLDDLLNRANSIISSQLFAMRSHVVATVSDINVVLKDRMQDSYDKLNEQQRQALDRAMLLANEAQASLDKLVKHGAFAASDLLCQTTVNFANYPNTIVGLGLPFERCFSPDILCLSSLEVRDVGTTQAEQMLQFRGVNLMPNNEYADATLLVSGKETKLPTAGGKSLLQLPLPGGVNGMADDTSLRGPLMSRVDFEWPKSKVTRRWFFELKPFQVRSVYVDFGFEIEGVVRTIREQLCHVYADGGSVGSREEYATCTIVPDSTDKSIERCEEGEVTSSNGDAGIRNRLFSVGACTWELRAKSKAWWGAGAWYDFIGRAHQVGKQRIAGPSFVGSKILNQNEKTWVIDYPEDLVPSGYRIIEGKHRYRVIVSDNEGNAITLTESRPSDAKFGSAVVVGKSLTITLYP